MIGSKSEMPLFLIVIVFSPAILFNEQGYAQQSIDLSKDGKAEAVIITVHSQTVTPHF